MIGQTKQQEAKSKGEKTKKRTSSKEEKARQQYRTEANNLRKKARYKKWLAKRQLRAFDTIDMSRGESAHRNYAYRFSAAANYILRRIVTRGDKIVVEKKPSIGLLKQTLGIPTKWTKPEGWEVAPNAT